MIIIKYYNLYVPINQNTNSFRHYGIKYDKILFFELHELLHVYSNECKNEYPPYIKAYFQIKSDYNLLRPFSYDISLILRFNKYLLTEMSSSCKYWIDKYIYNNCNLIDWSEIQINSQSKMSSKEFQMYKILHTKLRKHEDFFKRLSGWETPITNNLISSINTNKNISCINEEKENKNSLFEINELFTNFDITLPVINNSCNYLKNIQNNKELNLLEYLYFDIYRLRTDFNRNKDQIISSILFINKYVKIKEIINLVRNKVVCVISNNEYVILNVKEAIKLNLNVQYKLKKKRKLSK